MADYQELISILKYLLFERFAPAPNYIRGLLGDGQGNVLVPGRPDYNYARFNRSATETFEVFNKEVSQPVDGLPILIGELPWQPGLTQVVGVDWNTYNQIGWGDTYANIQAHASTHEWPDLAPGSDYIRTFLRAIVPLQGYGAGSGTSLDFYAHPYEYDYTGTSQYWPGLPPVSLAGATPPTGSMRYMGVYLNPATNQLGVVSGTPVNYEDSSEPPRPAFPFNVFPVAYARLYGGQQFVAERDTRDARRLWNTSGPMFTGTSSGGGGGNVWPLPDKVNIGATEYATFAAALSALVAGDQLLVGNGDFACAGLTPGANLELMGCGINVSNLVYTSAPATSYALRFTGGTNIVQDLTVELDSTNELNPAMLVTGGTNEFRQVMARATMIGGDASTNSIAWRINAGTNLLHNCEGWSKNNAGVLKYALWVAGGTNEIIGGLFDGHLYIDTGATVKITGSVFTGGVTNHGTLILDNPVIRGSITGGGTTSGMYRDTSGNLVVLSTTGITGGVWRYRADNLRVKEASLDAAITNLASGDALVLFSGAYTLTTGSGGKEIAASNVKIIGIGEVAITSAQNDVFTLDVRGDNVTLENLVIEWTGAGTAGAPLGGDGDNLRLINCRLNKTSGAPTTAYGLWQYGGTGWIVQDTHIKVTTGTNKYGWYGGQTTFYGGSIQGDTYDLYTDDNAAVVTLNNTVLVNGLVNFAGTLNWEPEAKITKNLLGDTLSTINSWQTGDTFNDIADDTYCGGLWNVVHNGQTPDITRQAGGSTDPFEYYFRCTFDSASSQAGIVQFLLARDTIPLRGQTVSLSFDAWGTAVVELRAAVISWGSTADTLTSDVVGTWATDNPTLATNWSYANTPAADITISSTRRRVTVNNITVPTTANNIAVFIWTSAEEASTDLFNIARVQLERGPVATEFVALNYLEELRRINTLMYVLGKITGSRTLGGRADGATTGFFGFQLPTEMRSVPTISLNNGAGNVRVNDGLVNVNVTAISTNFSTRANIGVNLTTDTGLTGGRPIFVDFTSTTSFLLFDSRL